MFTRCSILWIIAAHWKTLKDVVLKTINASFSYRCSEERRDKLLQVSTPSHWQISLAPSTDHNLDEKYFEREAGIWRHSVSHPNVLELYGYMMVPDDIFPSLVSPFYPEGNLRNFVEDRKNHGLPAKQRIELVRVSHILLGILLKLLVLNRHATLLAVSTFVSVLSVVIGTWNNENCCSSA